MHHNYVDHFAHGSSGFHRLDARAKLIAALAYTLVLISFDRYTIVGLFPLAIMPAIWLYVGHVPAGFVIKRILILSPFIAMLCIASPLFDHAPRGLELGPLQLVAAGGWLTAFDIYIKFALGVLALTALTCTTPFSLLLEAMRRLRMPAVLTMQLGFLYRYIFVLLDEAMRVRRARDFRLAASAGASRRLSAAGGVIGSLFVRTLERSERIHTAMCSRGYAGQNVSLESLRFTSADAAFLSAVAIYLVLARAVFPMVSHG